MDWGAFDWATLISALIGLVGGGGLTALLLRRPTKAAADADAVQKSSEALSSWFDNFKEYKEIYREEIEQKDTIIKQNAVLVKSLQEQIDCNKRTISEQKILISENTRKLKGHQTILANELGKKKYAERLICFREDCPDRQPPLGAYQSEDPQEEK